MNFATVCSGIEAASLAWNPLGWKSQFFSEIDKFPSALLAHRYPNTPNLGDMTNFKEWPDANLDVLAGGTPCQSFSNAGLRAGLDDPRGQLMLTYGAIAARYRPKWLVWENVPGVLSSNGGRDFGAFLGLLAHLGYGFAYRVLDAQFVRVDGHGRAVPQRRNRVFVVGCLGDWRSAAAVLLERESLRGDTAPRRRSGQGAADGSAPGVDLRNFSLTDDLAHTVQAGAHAPDPGGTPHVIAVDTTQITSAANRSKPQAGDPCHPLAAQGHAPAIAFHGSQDPDISGDVTHPVGRNQGQETCAMHKSRVRRLTPRECERLMGMPDDYTLIPWRGKPAEDCPDGPRYKALGNSWAINCARWIGRRVNLVEQIHAARKDAA